MFSFNHFNFNVSDLERSISFYKDVFGLNVVRESGNEEKGYKIVFMGDGVTDFRLELTWLKDHQQAYDLGEQEFHLAFRTDDYDSAYNDFFKRGLICYDNKDMGIFFVEDPDGYWIEVIPTR